MKVITFDLEMNKPSDKIIMLGYVINNVKDGSTIIQKRIYINPNELLNPEITQLTSIRQDQVDMGVSLREAYAMMCKDIDKQQTSKHPLQWGTDHEVLRDQLGLEWKDYTFSRRAIDVKGLYQSYAMTRPQGKTIAGLRKACEVLGLEFEGRQHDGLDDAINTFRVFKVLTDKMNGYDRVKKALTDNK